MGHKHDYWEGWRAWVIPKLGVVTQLAEDLTGTDLYVTGDTHSNQFVGRVPMPVENFEKVLHELGFHRNPLASLKSLSSGEQEEGSWRKIGFDGHPKMQLHVILYDGNTIEEGESDYTYVYAHWEIRWDVHPIKHYRGVDFNAHAGVSRMKNLLDEHGVVYEPIRA
jgi:hypothetical protein